MYLYLAHLEELTESMAVSEDMGLLLFAASTFPGLLSKVSLLEKSKGDSHRGKQGHCWQTRAVKSCPGNGPLAQEFDGYVRPKKDEAFMRSFEVWHLPISHNTACDSQNLTGDA